MTQNEAVKAVKTSSLAIRRYLLSLPERLVRSTLGLSAGVAREVGEVVLPDSVRRTQLYQNLVDATLRVLIQQVGEVEGVYAPDERLPDDFMVRRTAGNALEVLGIVAFRASPVWVLAALRTEWEGIRREARLLQPASLPSSDTVTAAWTQLKETSRGQQRSVFETSSMIALASIRALPEQARWLSSSARVGATRTGQIVASVLLDHYRSTLEEIQQTGYATYAAGHLRPYVTAAVAQFSPERRTLTERLLDRWEVTKR